MRKKQSADSGVKHRTPKESIKQYCLHCVGGSFQDVKACDANDPKYHVCPFHPYRLGKGRPSAKIIRRFCIDCMGGSKDFVRDCETTDCLCHPYRLGKNPHKIKTGRTADEMRKIRALRSGIAKDFAGEFERSPVEPALPLPLDEPIKTSPEAPGNNTANEAIADMEKKHHETAGAPLNTAIERKSYRQCSLAFE